MASKNTKKKAVKPVSSSSEEESHSSSQSKEISQATVSHSEEEVEKKEVSKEASSSEEVELEQTTKPTKKRARSEEDTAADEPPAKKPFEKKGPRDNEIFVGSLPFGTTEQTLKDLFQEEGATVTRVGILNNGGAAFVQFTTKEEAEAQLKWNNSSVGGRNIRVNMAGDKPQANERSSGAPADRRAGGGDRDRTIFVGGLPFNTGDDEVKGLFSEEGAKIERVNMINNGGCAFVIFSTEEEAKTNLKWDGSAFNGRKLRINMAGDKPAGGAPRGGGRGGPRGGGGGRRY